MSMNCFFFSLFQALPVAPPPHTFSFWHSRVPLLCWRGELTPPNSLFPLAIRFFFSVGDSSTRSDMGRLAGNLMLFTTNTPVVVAL